jgi:hypothetical protein
MNDSIAAGSATVTVLGQIRGVMTVNEAEAASCLGLPDTARIARTIVTETGRVTYQCAWLGEGRMHNEMRRRHFIDHVDARLWAAVPSI